jgi:hypothetical protein
VGEMIQSLDEMREKIECEVPYVDKKPYSHNIISLVLSTIENKFGRAAAIKAMKDFKLNKKGWKIPKE